MWTFAICVSGAWAGIKGVGCVSFFFGLKSALDLQQAVQEWLRRLSKSHTTRGAFVVSRSLGGALFPSMFCHVLGGAGLLRVGPRTQS